MQVEDTSVLVSLFKSVTYYVFKLMKLNEIWHLQQSEA